ncbi:MAG: hypothetical protein AB7F41_04890 [Methylocystis sp.]|uniref:hypothetical protein n=1 Tax=Methylocystis sp. TaxID=1911079 RepID=UPI003D0B29A3
MTTTSNERQRLRDAIAAQANARQSLDEATRALANAQSKWQASNQRAGLIIREIEEIEAEPDTAADALIAGLANGADLATLDRPKARIDELRAQLNEAEEQSARWRQTIKLAETTIADRRQAVELAGHYVDGAARGVVAVEADIDGLMREAEAARANILDVQAKLAALASSMDHSAEKRRTIDNYLVDSWLRDSPWRDRPAGQPIRDAFTRLKSDADASLKI